MSSGGGYAVRWGRLVQKRARQGVFGGKTTQFGNNVSEDGGNKCVNGRRRSDPSLRARGRHRVVRVSFSDVTPARPVA